MHNAKRTLRLTGYIFTGEGQALFLLYIYYQVQFIKLLPVEVSRSIEHDIAP